MDYLGFSTRILLRNVCSGEESKWCCNLSTFLWRLEGEFTFGSICVFLTAASMVEIDFVNYW